MFKKLIQALLGKKKATKFDGIKVAFHKDVNTIGEHGTINCLSKKHGMLEPYPVRFAFLGVNEPPKMDLDTMAFIWDQAECQGYTPLNLRSYRGVYECHAPKKPTVTRASLDAAEAQRQAANTKLPNDRVVTFSPA